MGAILVVYNFGQGGVNVDESPLHIKDNQLRKAQNAISDPLGVEEGITARPGLKKFNASAANGVVLGGIGVPLINLKTGTHLFYIGRGPLI
jgi:hypothetical protein